MTVMDPVYGYHNYHSLTAEISDTRRPGWDAYFLSIATVVAVRADCARRRVGAVLVDDDHRIVSTGYNGSPQGSTESCETCPRRLSALPPGSPYGPGAGHCHAVHAETNAILYAGRSNAKGATLYVTSDPCHECRRLIHAAGVKRVVILMEQGENA